jgi:hypothetical protein
MRRSGAFWQDRTQRRLVEDNMPLFIVTVIYMSFSYGFLSTVLNTYWASRNSALLEMALLFWFVLTVMYCFWSYKALKEEIGKMK